MKNNKNEKKNINRYQNYERLNVGAYVLAVVTRVVDRVGMIRVLRVFSSFGHEIKTLFHSP